MRRSAALAAAALIGVAGAWGGLQRVDVPDDVRENRVGLLLDLEGLPGSDLGVPGLVAGLLWLRMINDFGLWKLSGQLDRSREDYLTASARRILRLEPEMLDPALFAADVLAARGGQAEPTYEALLHALAGQSGRWEIYFRLGFVAYRYFGMAPLASEWWSLTGLLPGRPDYLPVLAAMIRLQRTGGIDEVLGELAVAAVRQPRLQREVAEVEAFRRLARRLAADLERYRERTGRWPEAPEELVVAGIWAKPPIDPWGSVIRIGPEGILPGERLPLYLKVWNDQLTPARETLRGDAVRGWRPAL